MDRDGRREAAKTLFRYLNTPERLAACIHRDDICEATGLTPKELLDAVYFMRAKRVRIQVWPEGVLLLPRLKNPSTT